MRWSVSTLFHKKFTFAAGTITLILYCAKVAQIRQKANKCSVFSVPRQEYNRKPLVTQEVFLKFIRSTHLPLSAVNGIPVFITDGYYISTKAGQHVIPCIINSILQITINGGVFLLIIRARMLCAFEVYPKFLHFVSFLSVATS